MPICDSAMNKAAINFRDSFHKAEKSFEAPHQMKIAVKMIGPFAQETDLQIICVFKTQAVR